MNRGRKLKVVVQRLERLGKLDPENYRVYVGGRRLRLLWRARGARFVYIGNGVVVKLDAYGIHAHHEVYLWRNVMRRHRKFFVPLIGWGSHWVAQPRIWFRAKGLTWRDIRPLERIRSYYYGISDVHPGQNCAFTRDGRLIIYDYGKARFTLVE